MARGYKRKRGTSYSNPPRPAKRRKTMYKGTAPNYRRNGFLGRELKFKDDYVTDTAILSTWTGAELDPTVSGSLCLNGVSQGDTENTRDGRQYIIKSIGIKGTVAADPAESQAAPASDFHVRLLLVHDKQTNAAQLNAEDVMTVDANVETFGFRNLENVQRFDVLADKTILVPAGSTSMNEGAANLFANAGCKRKFKMFHTFEKGLKVNTNGTGGTVSSITDNSLHLIGVCDAVGATTTPKIWYESRLRFYG